MEGVTFFNLLKWIGIASLVVFSFIFLGGIHVGPLSVRMMVAYGLLVYTLWRGSSDYLPTRGMQLYFVYVAVYIFVNILNLTAFSTDFIKDLIAVHFVSCIAIFTFPRLFKTEASIQGVYIILVLGFLLDVIATILQYNNSPWGWAIGLAINPIDLGELSEIRSAWGDANQFRKAIIAGIMGRAVGNGYFIATMLPVMTYFIWDKFKLKTLWSLVMFALSAICIYYIQQRMALAVATIYILFIILMKRVSVTTRVLGFAATLVIIAFFINDIKNYDFTQIGRLASTQDDLRSNILSSIDYFISEPKQALLGHNQIITEEDKTLFLTIGHNTFTDSLRLGGIFLFMTYVILFFYICKTLIGIVFSSYREEDYRTLGMALGCLCFMLYSQTHSTGIQSGSIMFWSLYMLTIQSHRVKYEAIQEETIESTEGETIHDF